jgi:NTP pyrophosphatase (non-canonical NTP hydrolase)
VDVVTLDTRSATIGSAGGSLVGMTIDEYATMARATAAYPAAATLLYPVLKLAGEAGEVAEKLGKLMRDEGWSPGTPLSNAQRDALALELGDVLWYVAAVAHDLGLPLDEVAARNVAKLADRHSRGVISGSGDTR